MSKLLYCVKIWYCHISKAAVEAFLRHLWYLSEELIALAFSNDGIDSSTKRKMISGLNREGSDDPPKRLQLDPSVIPAKEIPDFVTSKTLTFLTFLDWMVISLDTLILTAGSYLKSSISPNSVSTVWQL